MTTPKPINVTLVLYDRETYVRLQLLQKLLGCKSYSKTMIRLIDEAYEKVLSEGKD